MSSWTDSKNQKWRRSLIRQGRCFIRRTMPAAMLMLSLVLLGMATGCSLQRTEILYVRMGPSPEEARGMLRVADDRQIRVNVVGTNSTARMHLPGYILVHEQDMTAIIRRLKETEK